MSGTYFIARLKYCGRWALVLPGVILAAWLAYVITKFVSYASLRFATGELPDEAGILYNIYVEGLSSGVMGAVVVYTGYSVAPGLKRQVAFILACLFILFIGGTLTLDIFARSYWSIWGGLCAGAGSAVAAHQVWFEQVQRAQRSGTEL